MLSEIQNPQILDETYHCGRFMEGSQSRQCNVYFHYSYRTWILGELGLDTRIPFEHLPEGVGYHRTDTI